MSTFHVPLGLLELDCKYGLLGDFFIIEAGTCACRAVTVSARVL